MVLWRTDAVVWFSDANHGRILAGSFGFVWWKDDKVFCAPFVEHAKHPIKSYKTYRDWSMVRFYKEADISLNSLIRFARSGLFP
jgi:hypothetical protein